MDTAAITGAPAPIGNAPPPTESRATGGAEVPAAQRVNAARETDRAPADQDHGTPARDRGPAPNDRPDAGPPDRPREIRVSRDVTSAVFESVSRGSDGGAERSRADADRAYTAAARATERPSVARNSLDLV